MRRVSVRSLARGGALGAILCCTGAAQAQTLTEVWRLGGLASPESVFFDEASGRIVVSQMGVPFDPAAGADGTLGLISPEGEMIEPSWATGLVDPKGMAAYEGRLYVADVDVVRVVDMATGEMTGSIAMPESVFLNDVVLGEDGTVYVSDMITGAIYRLQGETVDQLVPAGGLPMPNGLLMRDGAMLVGSFGEDMAEDGSVAKPGGLMTLDLASGAATPVTGTEGSGSVDGVAALGDWVIYDDWQTGRVMGWRDDALVTLAETAPTSADLGVAGDLLLVPNTTTGEVVAYRLAE